MSLVPILRELHGEICAESHALGSSVLGRVVLTILREFGPQMQAAFLRAVRAATDATVEADVRRALAARDIDAAIAAVPWGAKAAPIIKTDIMGNFVRAFERAGILHTRIIAKKYASRGAKSPFSLVDERPLQYITQHGAQLVSDFGLQNRDALRTSLTRMFDAGWTPQQMATAIRPQIGLTRPWAAAVQNRHLKLLAEGMDPARAAAQAAKYAEELTRLRALNIARSEPNIAAGAAELESFRQTIDDGLVDRDRARKSWHTAGDDVVRDEHAELEAQDPIPIDEYWDGQTGAILAPPDGTNCRCYMELTEI